jgi:hypothetical protein
MPRAFENHDWLSSCVAAGGVVTTSG